MGGGGGGGLQDAAELQREVLEELQPYLQAGGEKSSAEDGSAQTQPGDVSQLTSAAPKTAGKSGEGLFVTQTPHGIAALARRFRDSAPRRSFAADTDAGSINRNQQTVKTSLPSTFDLFC